MQTSFVVYFVFEKQRKIVILFIIVYKENIKKQYVSLN